MEFWKAYEWFVGYVTEPILILGWKNNISLFLLWFEICDVPPSSLMDSIVSPKVKIVEGKGIVLELQDRDLEDWQAI